MEQSKLNHTKAYKDDQTQVDSTSFVTSSANNDVNANQTQSTMQIHVDNNSLSNFKGDDEPEEDSDDVEDQKDQDQVKQITKLKEHIQINKQEQKEDDENDDDDVFDQQQQSEVIDQVQYLQKPKNQEITQNQCYLDDQVNSEDNVQDEQQSFICDSDQEQQRNQKEQSENMKQKVDEKQSYKAKNKIKLYDYQNILFKRSLNKNRIIYLPTGKGKTLVSIASMYYYLCKEGERKKIIFLANTIQLVKQQADSIKRNLQKIMDDEELSNSLRITQRAKVKWSAQQIKQKVCCIHGEKSDEIGMTRRKKIQAELANKKQILQLFRKSTIIVMISQMFLNCLRRGYIKITDFSFIVFDQCHHCHGSHPYAGIMRQFYFDRPKPDPKQQKKRQLFEQQEKLPVIMGLSASPVMQQSFDKNKLIKQIGELCGNLNSRFTPYQSDKINSSTAIEIIKTKQESRRDSVPDLIAHFSKFRDHRQSFDKIQKHFPAYFECVKKVIDFLRSKYQNELNLQADPYTISNIQLLLFYDIKQCLLIKLRDVWLQLGQYAFSVAFQQLYSELGKISLRSEENKQILNEVMRIIQQYVVSFKKQFGICSAKFFSGKVRQLINLLSVKNNESSTQYEMVVIFASKRRTVKYLDRIIKDFKETLPEQQRKCFECDRVTGYSVKSSADYSKNQIIYEGDPSSHRFYAQVEHKYNSYLNQLAEQKNNRNNKIMQNQQSQSKNLASQLKRMRSVKYGKLLLQVQQKYSTQIQTIKRFRAKKFRVLITTSVTQQGFDIPECKIVISFDIPSSLKSYIQIKGRARQQFSKYYIFTNQRNNDQMIKNKDFYDDIINATFQVAMSKFSEDIPKQSQKKPAIISQEEGYKKIIIRESGALLNTSYALEILKMYCSSLRQPNKPRFYFIQTPNVAFRCLIYFPKTAPTSKPYIIGQSKSNKNSALKSAAFEAVKYLYVEKYIKADLRPKKYQQLQDQRQIQKFEDLQYTRKNQDYKRIFENDVRIRCQNVTDRKFIRFYFRTIRSSNLDFQHVNPLFNKHLNKFQKEKFPFQVYMMNFNNSCNMKQLRKNQHLQEIGVLTCFEQRYIEQVFSQYQYSFEQNSNQKFTLRLEQQKIMLDQTQYERIKRIHQFLISSSLSRQVYHYSQLNRKQPRPNRWISQKQKAVKSMYKQSERKYYPLLVILRKKNNRYVLDYDCIKKIQAHQELFKQIYSFHNVGGKQTTLKFHRNLNTQFQSLLEKIKTNKQSDGILVQSIQRQHCFSKCIISGKQPYNQQIQKNKDKKKSLPNRNKNFCNMFDHGAKEIKQIARIIFWNKYKKEKKKQIFQRDGKLAIQEVQNPGYYLLHQFILFPVSPGVLFKLCLATQFLFKAVFEYTLAFQFRNHKLPSIYKQKLKSSKLAQQKQFIFNSYPSVILQNANSVFGYLAQTSSSMYLRNIGKSYKVGSKFSKPNFEFSFSKINIDESSIMQNKTNMINESMSFNLSQIIDPNTTNTINNNSQLIQKSVLQVSQEKSRNLIFQIKVTQLLKVLTSRMYKFNKVDNYEEYQFIGDVVLKLLSTIQIFLEKPYADQSQLHISRANIICNANLHRKSILHNIYQYILSKKIQQLPPPYAYTPLEQIPDAFYQKSSFMNYNSNSQLQGFHYIPGKVHADVVQGLIGAFYLHSRQLNDCQTLLYCLDVLKKPSIKVHFKNSRMSDKQSSLPKIFTDLEQRIDYKFKNKGLLLQALTHSSFKSILHTVIDKNNIDQVYSNANKGLRQQSSFLSLQCKEANNNISTKTIPWQTYYQRLQFLGDSILDLVVVEYLHDKYGTKDQGTLSSLKQAGVSNKTLGMIAISLGMHELILMDYQQNDRVMRQFQKIQENFNHFLNNPQALMDAKFSSIKILGDVFQALIGAIFIDLQLDYMQAKSVIMKIIKEFLTHYTDLETLKKSSSFKYQQFLKKNNYRQCHLKKDTSKQIQNGNFRYLLVDRSGAVIDECWQTTQKRAWDLILQKFYTKINEKVLQ